MLQLWVSMFLKLQLFNTKVDSVNILTTKRKAKVFKGRQGIRSNFKKAIVTLEKGKTIDLAVGA
jgi:large subunit ribosomal protein L23